MAILNNPITRNFPSLILISSTMPLRQTEGKANGNKPSMTKTSAMALTNYSII